MEIEAAYREDRTKSHAAAALATAWAMVKEKTSVIMFSPGIPGATPDAARQS